MVHLDIEFLGGLSRCFDGSTKADASFDGDEVKLQVVVNWIITNLVKSNADVFSENGKLYVLIQPILIMYRVSGVLVLINEVDWELLGGDAAVCKDGDKIAFISTLHGG